MIPRPAARLALLAALAAGGCTSADRGVQRQADRLAQQFQAQLDATAEQPATEVDWPAALARLQVHNAELQEGRDAVATAAERLRQVNRDLIPGAAVTANVAKAITGLGDLRGDDAALSLYGFFNVPGLIQWRMRYYAADLELLRARWALELKARELTIQLRELFVRSQLVAQRRRQLALARQWDRGGPLALSLDASPPSLEREGTLWSLRREDETLQDAIAKLLGDSGRRWVLRDAALPAFTYAAAPPDLHDTARFGRLYRRLQAIDLEGARLRQRGVRLQYWPDLQVTLTSPPLYQSRGGAPFAADRVVLNVGATVPLDLRGSIAQQLRETRRDFARLETRLREQNAGTIRALQQARDALVRNARQLRLTELRLAALRGLPGGMTPARARENLERLLTLDQQCTDLRLEQVQLEGLFWLLDETRWTEPAALAAGHAAAPPAS